MTNRAVSIKSRYFGNRAFYATVIAIVVPIIIQNTVTNFVSLLDNLMVGQVGTNQMSGVAIANQLFFIYNLLVFGGISGPGIFSTQFFGARDFEGLRHTFRMKLYIALGLTALAIAVFGFFKTPLISIYLTDTSDPAAVAETLESAKGYLDIILIGLFPFAISCVYAASLRETGETLLPMVASISAVLVNLCFNYLLIFGHFGFPEMGVRGAAIATVISRFAELAIIVIWTHAKAEKHEFIRGVYRSFRIPMELVKRIAVKGAPLLINEGLWSAGVAMLSQAYSVRGLYVVAAVNISSTISNLFNVVFISMGNAVAIMAGQAMGAGDLDNVRAVVRKLIVFGLLTCVVMGGLLYVFSPLIPLLYNTEDYVRELSTFFLRVSSVTMFIHCYAHCCYFALRAGGRTTITLIFDSVFTWVISVPGALLLVHCTDLSIEWVYALTYAMDILKAILGWALMRTNMWIRNLAVHEEQK